MKNEILDDIFPKGIYAQVNNGEKVIWDGKPYFKFQWNTSQKYETKKCNFIVMKNIILDEISFNSLHEMLEKNEKIMWEGNPHPKYWWQKFQESKYSKFWSSYFLIIFLMVPSIIFVILIIVLFFITIWLPMLIFAVITTLIIGSDWWIRRLKTVHTQYLISNQRILIQHWSYWKKTYNIIPFSDIKHFNFTQESSVEGTIFITLKKLDQDVPSSYNLNTGERRHIPTLEKVEDVKSVVKIIQLGIKGKL